ncbi:MAG TPA: ATP-dependent DNA helicase [Candidatus Dormibacteraeota bacterium]
MLAGSDGPLRVLAGPGTGKTHQLVELYSGLVEQGTAKRDEILVLTFSTSAAGEIARRVDDRLHDSYDRQWISTFHSFCARLLRDHRPDRGSAGSSANGDQLLLNGFQEWVAMRQTLREIEPARLGRFAALRTHDSFVHDVLGFVALLKQNLVFPAPFTLLAEVSGTESLRALAAAYAAYQSRLQEARLADFRDLVTDVIYLFDERPDLLEKLRRRFRYVLVDEFQDVDNAQFFLVRQLAPPASDPHLVVFGDPDQSIYGFRGTLPQLLSRELHERYPTLADLQLEHSRRCPQPVLEAAERLLAATQPQRPPRRLSSERQVPEPAITVAREGNAVDEAFYVAREIRRRVVEEGRRPGEFAVLLRSTTSLSAPFEEAIRALGLPYEVRGLGALARNEVVRFVLAYLRALAAPDDPESLERVLASGLSGVPPRAVGRLRRYALEEGRPFRKVVHRVLYRLAARDSQRWPLPWGEAAIGRGVGGSSSPDEGADPAFMELMDEPELTALHAALSAFHRLRSRAERLPLSALAYAVLIETGLLRRVLSLGVEDEVRAEAMIDLRATVEGLESLEAVTERLTGAKPVLADFAHRLESVIARAVDDAEPVAAERPDAVQVMTVHQSKGLEFPFVFLSGFAHGVFPLPMHKHPLLAPQELTWLEREVPGFRASWPRDESEHLAEEARLAYVGMTRACEHLYVTYADEYDEQAGPSPFLELAAAKAETVELTRAGAGVEAQPLTVSEAETALALVGEAIESALRERLVAAGADLAFILSPESGSPFEPYLREVEGVEPGHFSATALNDYLKCPRLYWYNHHPGLAQQERSVEMERGSFLHEVLEEFHRREAEWRRLPPEDQRAWLVAALEERLQEYLARVEGVLERKAEEQELRRILDNYVRFATSSQPIRRLGTLATEKKFTLQIDGAEIRGKIDRINDTGGGTCEVVDYKTGRGGAPSKKYGEYFGPELHDVQLALYYLACQEGVGEDGEPIALQPRWLSLWFPKDWVYGSMRQVLFAVGEPAPGVREWVQRPLEPADLERGRQAVVTSIGRIRGGDFAPRPRNVVGTCLSYFGCAHATICPFGGGPAD